MVYLKLQIALVVLLHLTCPEFSSAEDICPLSKGTGWEATGILPDAFMNMEYHNFRVSIYRKPFPDSEFYCSPALIINPNRTTVAFNIFTKKFEASFTVLIWDNLFFKAVQAALSNKLEKPVPLNTIRILPIKQIRIDSTTHSDDYDIYLVNKWTSYANQPSTFTFKMTCIKNETCTEIYRNIQENPKNFLDDLLVYYSLQEQSPEKRQISTKSSHVLAGYLATLLLDKYSSSLKQTTVFLFPDEAKRLTLEIARNVMATEVTEEEVISEDQVIIISNRLETVLMMRSVSSKSFTREMWNTVWWKDDDSRPDLLTQALNDLYNQKDITLKEIIKEVVRSSSAVNISLNKEGVLGIGYSDGITVTPVTLSSSQADTGGFLTLLLEARKVSQWNGQEFMVKPIQLVKVNLSAFKSLNSGQQWPSTTTTIVTSRMTVMRKKADLSSRINVVESRDVSEEPSQVLFKTGFILPTYSPDIPEGWLPCNGTAVSADLYSELHKLTGGFTPDLQGRFPVGRSNGQALGTTGGEATHQLTVSEMPSHQHTHNDLYLSNAIISHSSYYLATSSSRSTNYPGYGYTDRSILTNSTGGNQAHNNLPPFLAVTFIIKT